MSLVLEPNINHLIQQWKKNTVMTSVTLEKKGYSPQLLRRYKLSGWLESIGYGAYAIKGQKVEWAGGLYALQTQLSLSLHPGGLTALEWSGQSHYLSLGERRVFLYGLPLKKLPLWFRKMADSEGLIILEAGPLPHNRDETKSKNFGDYDLEYSSSEQAFLELLYAVPKYISFHEARQISENLTLLRAGTLQELLERSRSIKVNRMALYLGEYFSHSWMDKLSFDRISLGAGKRVIHPNGVFDSKYGITVPPEDSEEEPYV
ncbi:MAG: type IV toxin-antitoxin system AbiEi family antitoxin domain-containing protein [Syntrophaceae bacterium]|nr:type IV toxin-antitoxin system AbiEi family antitoxin domain-containing protein [Syntrophaceae bacterium]MBN2863269.1 type IV toxin-antitoxin system AbiEi family antitoxin domain-containing protein [Bacteroidales bacterium]